LGFLMAIVLFSSIREQLEICRISGLLEGFPIALASAGLWRWRLWAFRDSRSGKGAENVMKF
jgi:Na+-translocating ferredoxin:NAD+ oxidoreductase RnfA subunit